MKSYKALKEDIGLSTGAGIANPDMPMGKPLVKRTVHDSFGICQEHMKVKKLKDGVMICEFCK